MKQSSKAFLSGALAVLFGVQMMLGATAPAYVAIEKPNATQTNSTVPTVDYTNLSQEGREDVDRMINGTSVEMPTVINETNASQVAVTKQESVYLLTQRQTVSKNRMYTAGGVFVAVGVLAFYYGFRYRGVEELDDEIAEFKQDNLK